MLEDEEVLDRRTEERLRRVVGVVQVLVSWQWCNNPTKAGSEGVERTLLQRYLIDLILMRILVLCLCTRNICSTFFSQLINAAPGGGRLSSFFLINVCTVDYFSCKDFSHFPSTSVYAPVYNTHTTPPSLRPFVILTMCYYLICCQEFNVCLFTGFHQISSHRCLLALSIFPLK